MKIILLIFSFLPFLFANSQTLEAESTIGSVTSINDLFTKHLKNSSKEEIIGTPFLFPNWENPGIVYSEGNKHSLRKLNYNILSDEIGSLKGKDSVFVYNKAKIDSFTINKKVFKKYNESFYEVLNDGVKINLLKKYKVEIVEGMFNPIDGTKEKNRFKIIDDFYIKSGNNGGFEKYIPSRKSISSIFKENNDLVKKFIKENKLSFKKEEDVIEIFEYYNKL